MMNERSAGGDGDETACGFAAVTRYTCVCGCPVERICVAVRPTTGGQFLVSIAADQSVEHLRQMVAQKLRVPRERICLLYRNKPLRTGTLLANSVQHGTHVTLLPSVEAGLVSHRPELSVLQALENLTPTQVTEFLSGKAPLNLTVRLGDHMMLIQLQLSPAPQTGASAAAARRSSRHATTSSSSSAAATALGTAAAAAMSSGGSGGERRGGGGLRTGAPPPPPCHHQHSPGEPGNPLSSHAGAARTQLDVRALAEASRNLTRTLKQLSSEVLSDDWSAPPQSAAVTTPSSASAAATSSAAATPGTCSSSGVRCRKPSQETGSSASSSSSSQLSDLRGSSSALSSTTPPATTSFSSALSSSTSTGGTTSPGLTSPRLARPGAIIETMHHHGKGVYSGTFSGTLNPTLQDRMGRPKRDIGTIIHILNDLLCAAPQYRGQEPQHQPQHQQGESEGRLAPPPPPFNSLSATASKGEELATRGKIEHLKMVMEERRRRRRQRQRRTAPYTTSWSATHETAASSATATAASATAPAASAADKREQVEADIADAVTTPALVACGGQHL